MTPRSFSHRWPVIDVLRGIAVIAMILFHFTWDLGFFQLIDYDISFTPEGRMFSHLIAGTFLFLVGVSLALAHRKHLETRAFLNRFFKIAGAAALVSLGTYFATPDEWIFFGVLHCIALSSLLALPFMRAPLLIVFVAALTALGAPLLISYPLFDRPDLFWLGLNKVLPRTNDYVPLLPWFGVVLIGIFAGRVLIARDRVVQILSTPLTARPLRALGRLGRWALPVYLLHQPVLMAALWAFITLAGPQWLKHSIDPAFIPTCVSSCQASGRDAPSCEKACSCLSDALLRGNRAGTDEALMDAVGFCRKEGAF